MDIFHNNIWKQYSKQSKNEPPRPLLLKSLSFFKKYRGSAIDIGCGAGNESAYLYNHGWNVLAIDRNKECLINLKDMYPGIQTSNVLFESLNELPKSDFIFAGLSIPFCNPKFFERFMDIILCSINVRGRFAGIFLGPNDDWSHSFNISFCTIELIHSLFDKLEIEFISEVEFDKKTFAGVNKHWNTISIIAKKIR